MTRRQGRPRAGREVLSRHRILARALEIIDQDGVEALSMRRLAAALGVDPMAIYHHVPAKEAVLAGVIETVFSELWVDDPRQAGWEERVRAFARGYRDLVRAHPRLALFLVANMQAGTESVMTANEVLYEALEESGLNPSLVAKAADVVVDYLNGLALSESWDGLSLPGRREDLAGLLERFPPERFPALRRAMEAASAKGTAADIDGLEVILAGIRALAHPGASQEEGRGEARDPGGPRTGKDVP